MPEATRQGVEDIKKGEILKRKKVWEDKEIKEGKLKPGGDKDKEGEPAPKKHKKMTPAQEERGGFSVPKKSSLPEPRRQQQEQQERREQKRPPPARYHSYDTRSQSHIPRTRSRTHTLPSASSQPSR